MSKHISSGLLCFALLLSALLPRSVHAQTSEDEIKARLVHQALYLRGAWGDNKLNFDNRGQPAQSYKIVPFTTAAMDVSKVHLKGSHLEIEGQRVGLQFDSTGKIQRVPFSRLKIVIDGTPGIDFAAALDAIFADNLSDVPSANTGPWRQYAAKHWPAANAAENQSQETAHTQPTSPVAKVGGSVQAPRVLKTTDPRYSALARQLKTSGNVQVAAVIDKLGMPTNLSIRRPAGLGLDEQSLSAVFQYRFAPATRDGTPIPVEIYIEVNFQIF